MLRWFLCPKTCSIHAEGGLFISLVTVPCQLDVHAALSTA